MSYDIYFIKKENLNNENIEETLEILDPEPNNEIFISKEMMKSLIQKFTHAGLKFEIFEAKTEDYFELNFSTYQLGIHNSQIVISLPFWSENEHDEIHRDIKKILSVLLANGFKGFDPQTEEFITEAFDF